MADDIAPRPLRGAHHAAFRCRDAAQTRWFYEDVLGLKAAAGLIIEVTPGSGSDDPYMHIFFELGDGNYLAFFDAPGSADPGWFKTKHGFDMHYAMEADSEADMLAMRDRVRSFGLACSDPIDHHFVRSVYMYDPNGIQVEITIRTREHDPILAHEGSILDDQLAKWSARTRDQKVAKFGADAIDRRAPART